jgi:hypothetical protein
MMLRESTYVVEIRRDAAGMRYAVIDRRSRTVLQICNTANEAVHVARTCNDRTPLQRVA